MVTRTAQGIPGDPINVGLVGNEKDVLCAMEGAGWFPADPVTLKSSIEIAGSVLMDRPYREAPVSALYYLNRREDLAFEKPDGDSADRRHHVRFWKVLDQGEEKRPVWLGAALVLGLPGHAILYSRLLSFGINLVMIAATGVGAYAILHLGSSRGWSSPRSGPRTG